MKIAYYPGCSSQGSSLDYELSTQAVLRRLGIHVVPIKDWNCCGSTPAHAVSTELSSALCARNLDLAAKDGAECIITPCPSCLSNLKATTKRLQDPAKRARINELLDNPVAETVPETTSVLQAIVRLTTPETIKSMAKRSLKGLKLVVYYGCLMSRPHALMDFGDPENPMMIEEMLANLGATMLDFPLKTACCGASFGIPNRPMTAKNSGRILELAKNLGADAVVVCCPLCQMNLDLRQDQANQAMHTHFAMPIPYYTQILGLALGAEPDELGFNKLIVPATKVVSHILQGTGGSK
ncbi:MAG: CoB--CoM heterodisulfide reductase iron-sulfur subunit B family protein [Desulfovibrio sp.]|nr:CoB--CoM heterodisulfide reductase iron-sulfur subunit B family protein [Desulfovibrio sp.]